MKKYYLRHKKTNNYLCYSAELQYLCVEKEPFYDDILFESSFMECQIEWIVEEFGLNLSEFNKVEVE